MDKTKAFKKILCLVMALMMIMPSLPANFVSAVSNGSELTPGTVALTKEANWVDYDNRIAEIKFTVKGEPVKTAVDVVLVIDRSGSMGFGSDSRYSPCTNPAHYTTGKHKNNNGGSGNRLSYGCTDRMTDAKNASTKFVDYLLDGNVEDEFGNKNRVALVSFNSSVTSGYSNGFTSTKLNITSKINNLSANDGTDYTDALNKAKEYIENRNLSEGAKQKNINSRPTFIVMLSDGRPEPSDRNGKSVADALKGFIGEKLTIFSLGLNMKDNDADVLKYIATDGGSNGNYKDVTNTATDLEPFLQQFAEMMKPAGTNASLQDVISQYFDYYEDDTYKPNHTIVHSGKNVTWNIGTITKDEIVLTFYVQLKIEYDISGTYPTNSSAVLTYDPIGNNPGEKSSESPNLSVTKGSIKTSYLLVDEASGRYIAADGNLTDDIAFAQIVYSNVLGNIDIGTHTITPSAPSGYYLYNTESVQVTLTEDKRDVDVNFKIYQKIDKYNYTINYYIDGTEDAVPGITPNPITGEATAGTVIPIVHFNVSGYKVKIDQPVSLTVAEGEHTVKNIYYEADETEYLNYTVEYYKDGKLFETSQGQVPSDNPYVQQVSTDNRPEGYITAYDSTKFPFEVTKENNIIRIYYINESGPERINYVIKYYKDGSETAFEEINGSVPADSPAVNSVSYDNMPEGYKVDEEYSTDLPFTVNPESENIINVYYIKVEEPGPERINYVVKYYKDGSETAFEEINGSVSVDSPTVNSVSYDNIPEGYKVDEENSTELPFTVNPESENIIKVYYIKVEEPLPGRFIIIEHFTQTGSASEVKVKTETKTNPVTTGSALLYGAEYKDSGIISQGFTFQSSTPESILVYAEGTTEAAISSYYFKLLYYTSGGGGGSGGGGNPSGGGGGTTIPEQEIPLAELEKTDHFAYVIGYPDGEVKPMGKITREEVAMIFYRLLTDESRNQLLSDTNPFTDLQGHDWSNRAISTLYSAGIINGYPDGTFRPSNPITRAEFATIAAKFDKLELNNPTRFTDIFGHWAEQYITSSENKGWIKGYPDMTFKPQQDITRAEAMTLINNVLGRAVPEENIHPDAIFWPDIKGSDWYYEAVMEATNSHDYIYEEDEDELWTGMKPNKVWP